MGLRHGNLQGFIECEFPNTLISQFLSVLRISALFSSCSLSLATPGISRDPVAA